YDTSDKLYFEPLTLEDVLHIYEREQCWGAIAQFGGQTPLNLALGLQKNGVNIIGTSPQSIEIAEDRKLFAAMPHKLKIPPPPNGSAKVIRSIREDTHAMACELRVVGLMNVQYAVKGEQVYVLEVNPRASRTVPSVSKAIGVPLAKLAAKVMAGKTLKQLGFTQEIWPKYWAVKESVFPFNRFHGQDILLSPEMRSTGE